MHICFKSITRGAHIQYTFFFEQKYISKSRSRGFEQKKYTINNL